MAEVWGVPGLEEPGRWELFSVGREGVETPPSESREDGMMGLSTMDKARGKRRTRTKNKE